VIGYLKGKVISLKPTKVLLDVGGVGYNVNISLNTFEKINNALSVSLYIFTSVKQDSISLFGFHSESEKEMFELLISINGIGPKSALGILSGIQVSELKNAILSSDISRIVAVPGIGKRTAERVMLELKNKINGFTEEGISSEYFNNKSEAVAALTTLGYNSKSTEKIVFDILSENHNISLEDLIKKALAHLNR
jgi:holliday junction DNA helicase RuvA